MVKVVVLCLAPHIEDRLLPQLVEQGLVIAARPAGASDAATVMDRVDVDLVVVSAGPRYLDADLVRAAGRIGAALVALAEDDYARAAASACGASNLVDADAEVDEILAAAESPREAAAPPPVTQIRRSGRGAVVVVWGPVGAPGRTTVATSIPAELAAGGARVALVDADTVGAAIAPALGLFDEAPGFAAACRLAGAGALTTTELDRVAQRHRAARGSFAVLTGIGRSARWPELSADRVARVLDVCRDWADHTVVDVSASLESDEELTSDVFAPRRNAATISALRSADRIVAVGAADPVGLSRFVRGYGDLLETASVDLISVVITKVRQSAVGLNPGGQIRSTLLRFASIDDPFLVPNDAAACDAALLTGRTLQDANPRSSAAVALRRLVDERLRSAPVSTPARRRRWRVRAAQPV